MTKKTYLKHVRRKLNLPKQWRDRVISDLSSSIDARIEDGLSEADVLWELGSPEKTAAEFNEQLKEYSYRKSPWRFLSLAIFALSTMGLCFTLLVYAFLDDQFGGPGLHSIGVIGGADGPTTIFLSASALTIWNLLPYLAIMALGLGGYFLLRRCKHRK